MSLYKWVAEREQREIGMGHKLLRATKKKYAESHYHLHNGWQNINKAGWERVINYLKQQKKGRCREP